MMKIAGRSRSFVESYALNLTTGEAQALSFIRASLLRVPNGGVPAVLPNKLGVSQEHPSTMTRRTEAHQRVYILTALVLPVELAKWSTHTDT